MWAELQELALAHSDFAVVEWSKAFTNAEKVVSISYQRMSYGLAKHGSECRTAGIVVRLEQLLQLLLVLACARVSQGHLYMMLSETILRHVPQLRSNSPASMECKSFRDAGKIVSLNGM